MIVYRITKSTHSSNISGAGAALFPGRWNKQGTAVLYTAESIEIALLETVVHVPPMLIPDLDLLTIEIANNSISELKIDDLPTNWSKYPAPTILSEIGQNWINTAQTVALKVPSSIISSSHNIILNCLHPDYNKVKVISLEKFYFDPRLLR